MVKTRFVLGLILACSLPALATESVVAIHVSELTQALETRIAAPPTPTGSGTTGYEWWTPWWRYFVMPESLKEALRSDGTPFIVVSDADISAGGLLMPDGTPRYPILISLASEAVRDDEVGPLRDYVAAGGFLFAGSSAFTRRPDGTSRGDFALASEMGLHTASSGPDNWGEENTIAKEIDHRLASHIPTGDLEWEMPLTSEDISWGTSPSHTRAYYHHIWRTNASGASVIVSNHYPYIAAKSYGRGQFIYHAAMQPLIGNGGHAPGMYAYGFFRNAIEWAFESANLPLVKVSPWPYPYNAAYLVRHDFESYWWTISHVEDSAQAEAAVGAKGDYYFCTGALRDEMQNSPAVVDGLRRAVSLYGATIGSHNGGLKNPNNPALVPGNDDYWHWGPDEALDITPPGYASGRDYARASIAQSFTDLDGWLTGLGANTRTWVAPYFNGTRDASYDVLDQAGAITSGEQKISPFPHGVLSTKTAGKRFRTVALPVSDWFISGKVRHATDDGHSSSTVSALIDYYYNLGALVNLYSHDLSTSGLPYEYLHGCAAKPAIWASNAVGLYGWWTKRSSMQVVSSHALGGNRLIATMTVSGAADPEAAVELVIPDWTLAASDIQVRLNGFAADPASYRVYQRGLKIRVGTTVSTVEVSYPAVGVAAVDDAYSLAQGTTLSVSAPGVLVNDGGGGPGGLSAVLVSPPGHGALDLRADGALTYTPAGGFSGVDSFSYRATDGNLVSNTAVVTLTVISPVGLASLSLSPSSVRGGNPATGTVTLSGPAPAGGAVVALTSSDTAAQVPASVTVVAGSTAATFAITTSVVANDTSVTIQAAFNGTTKNAALGVTAAPPPQLSLGLNPASVTGGGPSTGTLTLSAPAPSGGTVVTLTSGNTAAAQVPASVTVAAGATTATFTITTAPVIVATQVTITASSGGVSQPAVLTVLPQGGSVLFSDDFTGITGNDPQWTTVLGTWNAASGIMNGSSPLSSYGFATANRSWTDYSVQARLQLPAVAYGGGLGGRVDPVTGAHYGVWIYPEGTVGGTGVVRVVKFRTWTTYSGAFMAQANLPGVGTGWHTLKVTFEGSRIRVSYDGSQYIDVTDSGFDSRPAYAGGGISLDLWTRTAAYFLGVDDVLVVAGSASTLSAVSLNPTSVLGGNTSTGTVTLTGAAPAGGALVTLTSNNTAAAQVPASVTVAAGATTATFTVTTSPVAGTTPVTISGTYGGTTQNATLTVTAPVAVNLSSVILSPTSVLGGSSSTGTATLDGAAPAGGALVTLTSNNTAAAQVPASVTVAAGATTATFTVTTSPVASTTSATISGTYNSVVRTATLTVTAPVAVNLSSVILSPTSVLGGSSSTGTATLDGAAPAGGAVVTLASSNTAAAQVPASVTVAAGATTATFTVTTSPVASNTSVTISGTYNSAARSATLTVTAPIVNLTSVTLSPTSVLGGNSSTGTVTLDGAAPVGGAIVTLTSSNTAAAQAPASVMVAAGATTATFTVTTSPVASNTSVTISGIYNGVTRTRTLTVTPAALSSVTLSPTSVLGGTSSVGTATLSGRAPSGGAVVTLASSNTAAAQVPASVTVAAGATTATFTVTTSPVASNASVTISGLYNGTTRTRTLTVTAAALASLSLNPTTVLGGNPSTGTVVLTGPAPAGGAVVTLTSNNAAAQVPASVTVASGASTASFVVTTSAVVSTQSPRVSATYRGTTRRANLTVNPPTSP